jgi:Na+-transporting NADH:ubiquinone oxidoreductase subunit C
MIVAVVLAIAATSLKPRQDANRAKETIIQIMEVAGYKDFKGDILNKYKQVAKEIQLPQSEGEDSLKVIEVTAPDGKTEYILSLHGKGLWGAIWGYICFADDGNTINGTVFAHKSETPGLGAEIATPKFENSFIGKTIFDENGDFVSVRVVKGGVAASNISPQHGVDAISGGTITSNGVDKMLFNCLQVYVPFLKNLQNKQFSTH